MQSESEAVILAMKPADQRVVIAKKMLDCRTATRRALNLTPAMLRDYIALDAKFFKGYGRPLMVQMLADLGIPDTANIKNAALAAAFYNNTGWMPIGF